MVEWDDETHVSSRQGTPARKAGDRDRAYLIVLAGSNVGEMYKISKNELVLGRGQQADLQILDDGVSRRHAVIRTTGAGMVVEDLGSRNGTFVNGDTVTLHVLRDGDKIQVGSTTILKFTYHDNLDESFQRQMYDSALRDGLTKAFNKKYFLDRMESEFRFARRHKVPLSLVMIDIDHFKQVNDSHGHLAGDMVLKTLAGRVLEAIRKEDVFARYGGEEFALLCRAIEQDRAAQLAERIRAGLEGFAFVHAQAKIPVTISLGVAALPEIDVEEPVGLIGAADQALYEAKRAGRNRVVVAGRENLPLL